MRHDDGFPLIDGCENDARPLSFTVDGSLEALRAQFYDTLRESAAHPSRASLRVHAQHLLTHLEALPGTAAHPTATDTDFFAAWLRLHTHYLRLISDHLRAVDRDSVAH